MKNVLFIHNISFAQQEGSLNPDIKHYLIGWILLIPLSLFFFFFLFIFLGQYVVLLLMYVTAISCRSASPLQVLPANFVLLSVVSASFPEKQIIDGSKSYVFDPIFARSRDWPIKDLLAELMHFLVVLCIFLPLRLENIQC